MSLIQAVMLGVIQGITEFLPISSSGHLVITEALVDMKEGGLLVEVTLHAGTMLAVIFYFRSRLYWMVRATFRPDLEGERARKYMLWLLIATIPAGLVGVLFRDSFEAIFEFPSMASAGLIITGAILFSSRWSVERGVSVTGRAGLWIGFAQALAILPGISRSGSTIATGMWSGVDRSEAAEFSFLLSVPAIGGASILEVSDLLSGKAGGGEILGLGIVLGFAAAFLSGYAAIAVLLKVLKKHGLAPFAWYCWLVGLLTLFFV